QRRRGGKQDRLFVLPARRQRDNPRNPTDALVLGQPEGAQHLLRKRPPPPLLLARYTVNIAFYGEGRPGSGSDYDNRMPQPLQVLREAVRPRGPGIVIGWVNVG